MAYHWQDHYGLRYSYKLWVVTGNDTGAKTAPTTVNEQWLKQSSWKRQQVQKQVVEGYDGGDSSGGGNGVA